ncbi:MAG: hypothetical protein GX495_06050 [Chloroflexi bacterium]|jgi:hypothetical protein|nr:hypothetical protein [Chloroflexota bacterium]
MAKKSRRTTVRAFSQGPARTFEREFNPDYTYVKKDLRRIGILAGSFFAVLIVLSFIL